MSAADAAGPRDGDFIRLENAWAHVVITRATGAPPNWIVTGDIQADDGFEQGFVELSDAITYAWRCLAEFQQGRGD